MRKMIVAAVALMLAGPAPAEIAITLTEVGHLQFEIGYSGNELARAFALDITVSEGTIDAISDYAVGDEVNGYGIFPANFSRYITVDADTGQVNDWAAEGYTPVADPHDPGALGGLGTSGITVEMASLYEWAAPTLSGRLFVFTVSQECSISVSLNATRGNVVLEDGSEAVVDLSAAQYHPSPCGCYSGPHCDEWLAVGMPLCWLSVANPRQCHGDADGISQGKKEYWVSTGDLDVLVAAWNKTFAEIRDQEVGGVPLICADFNHLPQGKREYRVSTDDLDILIANWNTANRPDPNCP